MDATAPKPQGGRILWLNVLTVLSAAILIGAEVFGARLRRRLGLRQPVRPRRLRRPYPASVVLPLGIAVMVRFVLNARHVEPFTES